MKDEPFQALAKWIDRGAAPGGAIVLVSPGEEPIGLGHGYFSDANSPQVSEDTVYDTASLTKVFATALVLRLHEQGKLSILERCSQYLPNFQHSKIRIVDLLTHRLGMAIALSVYRQEYSNKQKLHQALMKLEPPSTAAAKVDYANIQFFYIGVIIERITGKGLREAMHELTDSLGLGQTYTGPDIAEQHIRVPPTEVVGAKVIQGVTQDESSRLLGGITGHAGIFSTARDLAMFGNAWVSGQIVQQHLAEELAFKNYDLAGTDPQALGWWLRVKTPDDIIIPTPRIYSHSGFTGVFLAVCPENGKVAAFTCNRTYYGRQNVMHRYIWKQLIDWIRA